MWQKDHAPGQAPGTRMLSQVAPHLLLPTLQRGRRSGTETPEVPPLPGIGPGVLRQAVWLQGLGTEYRNCYHTLCESGASRYGATTTKRRDTLAAKLMQDSAVALPPDFRGSVCQTAPRFLLPGFLDDTSPQ